MWKCSELFQLRRSTFNKGFESPEDYGDSKSLAMPTRIFLPALYSLRDVLIVISTRVQYSHFVDLGIMTLCPILVTPDLKSLYSVKKGACVIGDVNA